MRSCTFLIFIFVFTLGLTGCQETAQKKRPQVSIEGVKMGDLVPRKSEKLPAAINLKIHTFHIPVDNYAQTSGAFNSLSKDQMRFSNYKSFKANGFETGFGNASLWKMIGDTLQRTNAKRTNTRSLVVYDALGDDYLTGELPVNSLASYYALNGSEKEIELPPGFVGWRIKARILPDRRGVAQVKIQGIFKQYLDNMLSRLPDFDNGDIIFKPTSMIMNMHEGDYILLGPDPNLLLPESAGENEFAVSQDGTRVKRIKLSDLFFRTTTDINLPNTSEKPQNKDDQNVPEPVTYRHVKNVDVIEIYLIACVGVEN